MKEQSVRNALAAFVMMLVLAGVALIYWAGEQRETVVGPILLVEDSLQRIWVLGDHRLYVLDEDGRLLRQHTLESLQVDDSVNALAAVEDGGVLLGALDSGRLYEIGAGGHLQRSFEAEGGLPYGFSLAYDSRQQQIFVAHTGLHRMLVLDRTGRLIHQAGNADGSPGRFHFPNHLTLASDGKLHVPDTNHHEIEILNVDLSRAQEPVRVPAVGDGQWPVSVAVLPDGRMAVSTLNHGMMKGHAALLAANGELLRELALPNAAEPAGILVRQDDLLLADRSDRQYQVIRYSLDGMAQGRFGDAEFQASLDDMAARHRLYGRLRVMGQAVAVVAGLLLLVLQAQARNTKPGPVEKALPVTTRHRPLWSSLLLSLLLPGLGQLNQRRSVEGALYLLITGVLGATAGLMLFIHVTRITQVSVLQLYALLGVCALYWILVLADVWRYERR